MEEKSFDGFRGLMGFCVSPDGKYIAYKENSEMSFKQKLAYPARIMIWDSNTEEKYILLDDISAYSNYEMFWQLH